MATISDILDFSTFDTVDMVLEKTPFSLRECVENAVTLLAPQAHRKQLELISIVYSDVPDRLVGDATRLQQILINLLGNSINCTPTGEVVLRTMLEKHTDQQIVVMFSATCCGIGTPGTELEQLASVRPQTGHAHQRDCAATALSLDSCRALTAAMGGRISVASAAGEGFSFRASVALRIDAEQPSFVALQYPGRRVVLIEPHALARASIRNALEELALRVLDYPSLMVDDLTEQKPDVLLIGSANDNLSTQHLAEQIKSTRATCAFPVVALLSSSDQSLAVPLTAAGAATTLCKPIDKTSLIDAMDKALKPPPTGYGGHNLAAEAASMTSQLENHRIRDEIVALRFAGGSGHMANQLLDALLVELPGNLERFDAACRSEDWLLLRELTHRLRGATAVCGVPALHAAIDELNVAACSQSMSGSARALLEVQQQADRLAEYSRKIE